jgi:hypothetical protein
LSPEGATEIHRPVAGLKVLRRHYAANGIRGQGIKSVIQVGLYKPVHSFENETGNTFSFGFSLLSTADSADAPETATVCIAVAQAVTQPAFSAEFNFR